MPPISVLIKPTSGNCNLRCDYCFYYDTMEKREKASYGFMSLETLEIIVQKVLAYAEKECTFAFQGGEPTLIGIDFFRSLISFQKKYNVNQVCIHNSLQTNGYNLNKEWALFFKEHDFLIGLSLDGIPKCHDMYRKTPLGKGSFARIMETAELLKKTGVRFNILSVVHGKNAGDIQKNYQFFRKNGYNYLQFIACLDPLGEEPGKRAYSLTPEVYGRFLIKLFELWYRDLLQGEQPYIRMFENYIGVLVGMEPESCDMKGQCSVQYVAEADGSVYPCDFFVLDEYKLGNFKDNTVEELRLKGESINFVSNFLNKNSKCAACKYDYLCRGGCMRTKYGADKEQYFCESYQIFFEKCLPAMEDIADKIKRQIKKQTPVRI